MVLLIAPSIMFAEQKLAAEKLEYGIRSLAFCVLGLGGYQILFFIDSLKFQMVAGNI
jgi:hypothetical protein